MSTEETLVNFFLYSLCIYPVTNWFVTRHVKYVKYKQCFEGNIVDYNRETGIMSIEVNRSRIIGNFIGPARYKVGLLGIDMDSNSSTNSSNQAVSMEVSIDFSSNDVITLPMQPGSTYVEGASISVIRVDEEVHGLKKIYKHLERNRYVIFAISFLVFIASCHLLYEISERGPNHYQLLGGDKTTPMSVLKKLHRKLSLELHPDKNKSPTAIEEFRAVDTAFTVLKDSELRRVYEILGDHGVKIAEKSVVDHRYIITQMLVYYFSSLIFTFLMTFSEPTGDAMKLSIFGLFTMGFVEVLLVLEEYRIPNWITTVYTSYDVITWLHRLFPAFLNGCRCILGAFIVDRRVVMIDKLESLSNRSSLVSSKSIHVVHETIQNIQVQSQLNTSTAASSLSASNGSMASILHTLEKQINHNNNKEITNEYKQIMQTASDHNGLMGKYITKRQSLLVLLRNIGVYILVRWLFIKQPRD